MTATESDERRRLIEGGTSALAELFLEYRDRLERIVSFRMDHRIRSRVDPADVLQEAYLEIARRSDEFVQSSSVSLFVWMRQRTLQTLVDIHRRHFREKRDVDREIRFASDGTGQSTSVSIARFLIADQTSPSQAFANAEEVQRLQNGLDIMNETDREVLALRHFEQLSNNQVAEVLSISVTAASNRYVRAAARLSEILTKVNHPNTSRTD